MSKANRRARSDSAAAAVSAMANAARPRPRPPKHCKLRKRDLPFWRAIIDTRSRDEWNPVDLVVAAQLARCQSDFEAETDAMEKEETVEYDRHDRSCVNARCRVLEILARREMALMRMLRLAGPAATNELNKRKLEWSSRSIREGLMDDDDEDEELLAQ